MGYLREQSCSPRFQKTLSLAISKLPLLSSRPAVRMLMSAVIAEHGGLRRLRSVNEGVQSTATKTSWIGSQFDSLFALVSCRPILRNFQASWVKLCSHSFQMSTTLDANILESRNSLKLSRYKSVYHYLAHPASRKPKVGYRPMFRSCLKNIFSDFFQTNYLNFHRTDRYDICRDGRTLSVNKWSEVIFRSFKGVHMWPWLNPHLVIQQVISPKRQWDRAYSCFGSRIGSCMWFDKWHHFQWPWMTLTAETASGFYRAMLCIRGTGMGLCLSVSVFVCHKSHKSKFY